MDTNLGVLIHGERVTQPAALCYSGLLCLYYVIQTSLDD